VRGCETYEAKNKRETPAGSLLEIEIRDQNLVFTRAFHYVLHSEWKLPIARETYD
jgi:hypothetical protein